MKRNGLRRSYDREVLQLDDSGSDLDGDDDHIDADQLDRILRDEYDRNYGKDGRDYARYYGRSSGRGGSLRDASDDEAEDATPQTARDTENFEAHDTAMQDAVHEEYHGEAPDLRLKLQQKGTELQQKQQQIDALQAQIAAMQKVQIGSHGGHSQLAASSAVATAPAAAAAESAHDASAGAGLGIGPAGPSSHRALLQMCSDGAGNPLGDDELRTAERGGSAAASMRRLRSVQYLRLHQQQLHAGDLPRVCTQLQWLTRVRAVDLSHNDLGDDACQDLMTLLKPDMGRRQGLTELNLSHNRLGAPAASMLANSLARNNTLQALDVSCNPMASCDGVGAQLTSALASNVTLWRFAISAGDFATSSGGAAAKAGRAKAKGAHNAHALAALPLRQTEHRRGSAQQGRIYHTRGRNTAVSSVPKDAAGGLMALSLQFARLSRNTAHALAEHAGALTALDLRFGFLGAGGAKALAKVLSGPRARLTALDLRQNAIGSAGAAAIFGQLRSNRQLTLLDVRANNVQDHAIKALARVLASNATLTRVDLSRNPIGASALQQLQQLLASKRNTTLLSFGLDGLSSTGARPPHAQGVGVALRNTLALLLRRNRDLAEDEISTRVREGLRVVAYEPEAITQTVTGGSSRLQRYGLQMHTIQQLSLCAGPHGSGTLRLEWELTMSGAGGAAAQFDWFVTRVAEDGAGSVAVMGGHTAATETRTTHAASGAGAGAGAGATGVAREYRFSVRSVDWHEGQQLALWIRPRGCTACTVCVRGFIVSVEEHEDHGAMYLARRLPDVPLGAAAAEAGGGAGLGGPAAAAGMSRVHSLLLCAGGDMRVSWHGKVVDVGSGASLGFRWLLTKRFCMTEERVVARGTTEEVDEEGPRPRGFLPFAVSVERCSAQDTLCLWVGPLVGQERSWRGTFGAQVAHLHTFKVSVLKPSTAMFSPRPVLNFASKRPFQAAADARWVL